MREKRKYVRLGLNADINWRKIQGAYGGPVDNTASAKNISCQGICLIVYQKLNVGDVLELEIELGPGKLIRARARVAWINEFDFIGKTTEEKKYDAGLEFINLSEDERMQIEQLIIESLGISGDDTQAH